MSDHKQVLLFGSFTEDETRFFQSQLVENNVRPLEKARSQFGSLNSASLNSSDGSSAEPKQTDSSVSSKNVQGSKLDSKDERTKNEKAKISNNFERDTGAQANGSPNSCLSHDNGITENGSDTLDLASLPISETEAANTELLSSPKVHQNGIQTPKHNSILVDSSAVVNSVLDVPKISSEKTKSSDGILPRGLINSGNLCFLNATLQALLSCSPFVQLLQDLRNQNIPKIGYPTLNAFVEFISDFDMPDDSSAKNNEREVLETGKPFSPIVFDPVLKKFTPDLPTGISSRPRQEDAQEFLSFVMDQMHNELLKLDGHFSGSNGGKLPLVSYAEDDGWETVGPKNKSAVTRTQSFVPSELSAIFGGQLRSVVKATGNKASATVQPFLLLHLDIFSEAVHTIEDALHLFSAPETVEGYRTSAGKAAVVSASKSVKIQTLSKILILHLMRFSYGSKGSTKLHKPVRFPLELVLGRELLVSSSSESRKYELVATITHHGREPSKGHYTADARYSNGQWLRFDDASVTSVGAKKVLHDQAYVLFYRQV
ncbi:ubiquitin carboxyl-terminal hydrolase 24 isoform X1 [Elaeis guineensis]|uniref:Ubiquitin carboxyl-terminal hydrolase n=1 Tax=Elaeis guineensis var. tenera TaxID=51953 RepID=A0A6I9S769_ELAGV|nr:ubiquitin carboxyl-terminal hydrolase 24 isoform X1 [Elaeis guineensis]